MRREMATPWRDEFHEPAKSGVVELRRAFI
jgi:hypothetical protein